MFVKLDTNFGALTPEDHNIIFRRSTRAESQYVRAQMRDAGFDDALLMSDLTTGRVSICVPNEEEKTDRGYRLRDRSV